MPENTQRVSVGGFSFENKDEAEQAKKEILMDRNRPVFPCPHCGSRHTS